MRFINKIMNNARNISFSRKSLSDLKRIVDNGSLASECASYWLKKSYAVDYYYTRK